VLKQLRFLSFWDQASNELNKIGALSGPEKISYEVLFQSLFTAMGGFHKVIYTLRLKFVLCANLFTLI
jgi:hypothetical protein